MAPATDDQAREKQKLFEAEIVRLEEELLLLERQWNKRHWLLLFGLFTIPGYFFFGPPALALGLLATPGLFATQSYLLAVRRAECQQLILEGRQSLLRITGSPDAPSVAPSLPPGRRPRPKQGVVSSTSLAPKALPPRAPTPPKEE